jgi:hypothetical protein
LKPQPLFVTGVPVAERAAIVTVLRNHLPATTRELVQLKVRDAIYHCVCGANVFQPSDTDTTATHYECRACRRGYELVLDEASGVDVSPNLDELPGIDAASLSGRSGAGATV